MIREVDLVSYLPSFIREYREPVEVLEAENPEFFLVWKAADRILYNHFILTADEEGIRRYEKMLGIYPSEDDTLESRRIRVQNKWFNALPYTFRMLVQKLEILCGDRAFSVKNHFESAYTLYIDTNFEEYGGVEQLEYLVNAMVPVNIVVVSRNCIWCKAEGMLFAGGGICAVDEYTISNDFRERYNVAGCHRFGAGVIMAETITAETDGI